MTGNRWFRIRYAGQRHQEHGALIVGVNGSPAIVVAVDAETQEEIVLFDGSQHGYDALFGDAGTSAQRPALGAWDYYQDQDGEDTFGVGLSAYYQIDYEDEEEGYLDEVDEQGGITLPNGRQMPFAEAQQNGFDCFQIAITNQRGRTTEIVSEELA
ncbi:hypothetical protein [Hymenobacter canadensis]|uniref:Uncharacterized protein n=1 Tax=Hymenobacter canadensis TaxID=2999067 RepID=A0ABY7LUY5_9BACT|nr:hypothetical protein [Hymenobacter canadensis]WBA44196.1 hypothetical protein O3303_20120 [Hymenobacter canadensis]